MNTKIYFIISLVFLFGGCAMTENYYNPQADEKLTVGKVQKEIRVGMSSAEVVQVMGSPNIVTTDELRREVWVYDKFATQAAYSKNSAGIGVLLFGVASLVGGGAGGVSGEGGTSSRNQRTLTIIIKFDENNKVRDFSYHSSSF